ncbi:MAG: hypothetical protein IPG68_16140 [Micrococcales bacterium]|nr:hypothetical protein [Micrococcales bacterium]
MYRLNRVQASTDAFMALPVDVLTSEYFVLGWPAPGVAAGAELAVRGGRDAGRHRRDVPADRGPHLGSDRGSSTTKTLNNGEALPVESVDR